MEKAEQLTQILQSFRIKAKCVNFQQIDESFYYDIELLPTAKIKDIFRYTEEIGLALKTASSPTAKILHEEGLIRLEFIAPRKTPLSLFNYFRNDQVPQGDVVCLLGQSLDRKPMWMDLAKNPHMLVAGTTGSGKSTLLHNLIANIFNYNDCYLALIDPKRMEFQAYKNLKNTTVVSSFLDTMTILDNAITTMEYRYQQMEQGISINKFRPLVIMIDEFADIVLEDQEEIFRHKLSKLAQKSRAAKISMVIATQRPSVNVINGDIKANFPVRIACRVASGIDARVIMDIGGAEKLMGKGDALVKDHNRYMQRFQIAYTNAEEVVRYFGK